MKLDQLPGLDKQMVLENIEAVLAVQNDDTKLDDSSVYVEKNEDDVLDAGMVDSRTDDKN